MFVNFPAVSLGGRDGDGANVEEMVQLTGRKTSPCPKAINMLSKLMTQVVRPSSTSSTKLQPGSKAPKFLSCSRLATPQVKQKSLRLKKDGTQAIVSSLHRELSVYRISQLGCLVNIISSLVTSQQL